MGKWIEKFEVYDCENETVVYITSSNLEKIPKFINCAELKELSLSSNKITKLENLDNLKKLKTLYLSGNPLKYISNKNIYQRQALFVEYFDKLGT